MKRPYRLTLLLPLLGMSRCPQQPVPTFRLPPATQRGANVVGFVLNGRVWRNYSEFPYDSSVTGNNLQAYYSRPNGSFRLEAGLEAKGVEEYFAIEFDTLARPGTYHIFPQPKLSAGAHASRAIRFVANNATRYGSAGTGSTATLVVTTLDTLQQIITGTFSARLRGVTDTTTVVNIDEGRFDVRYW